MPDKKEPKSASEMLDALFDFIEGSEEDLRQMPIEKVEEELGRAGIDPTSIIDKALEMLAAARAEIHLQRARDQRERLEHLQRHVGEKSLSDDEIRQRYQRVVGQSQAAAAFRKFEGASARDQESALEDLGLLDKMDDADEDA